MKPIQQVKYAFLALVLIVVQSCIKGPSILEEPPPPPPPPLPVVAFDVQINPNPLLKEIQCTNQTEKADTYYWEFGDNTTSTEVSPSHKYGSYGTYTVKLTATSIGGSVSQTKTVDILPPYNSVVIKQVVVNRYVKAAYDAGSDPDLYIAITQKNNTLVNTRAWGQYPNWPSNQAAYWTFPEKVSITDFNSPCTLSMFDADDISSGDQDDFIFNTSLTFSVYTTGGNAYPKKITFPNGYIDVEWEK